MAARKAAKQQRGVVEEPSLTSWPQCWRIVIPGLQLRSESNLREHFRARAARVSAQREVVKRWLMALKPEMPRLPCRVTITRVSPRGLDDDNTVRSIKHVRDEFAAWIGVDDRHQQLVRYTAEQRKGLAAVEIVAEWDKGGF